MQKLQEKDNHKVMTMNSQAQIIINWHRHVQSLPEFDKSKEEKLLFVNICLHHE